MKLYAIVAAAAILTTATATAQHSAQKVSIGIKGGLNLTNIHNEQGAKYDTKIGFHAGLIGHIHLVPHLALQPEIVYSAEGAKYTINDLGETNDYKRKLGYINMPVLVQYMFDNGFRLQAGPQIGFLVSAKSEVNGNNTDIKTNIKHVDFALSAGVGYVHPATGLGIDARYNLGLSNINENGSTKSTNRGFQLGVFYLFNHSAFKTK